MAECEPVSPVTRKGSKVGSGQPLSPGARTDPSRGRFDSIPQQPSHGARASHDNGEQPGEVTIVGPKLGE
jgi:hypothetical protein